MQQIIKHLFRADSLEEVSREQLEQLVEEYPSFSIGRFLLSRKLQAEEAPRFKEEAQRTNLYFTNPFWLQWMLQNAVDFKTAGPVRTTAAIAPPPVAEPVVSIPEVQEIPEVSEIPEETEAALPPATVEEPIVTTGEPILTAGSMIVEEPEEEEIALPETTPGNEEAPLSAADLLLKSIAEAQNLRQSLQQLTETHAGLLADQAAAKEDIPAIATPQEELAPTGPLPEEPAPTAIAAEEPVAEIITAAPIVEAPPTVIPEEPAVIFEPYHTIDYFASQGIRLTLDENPNDRLGQQLKSFTEWLKVMRKLPQKDRQPTPDSATESRIQTFAAHSIEDREILTETMAEVLAKQGMLDKAREVYSKLSLLNPDKRAYFATKIEKLKNN
jgi:hypothetical protein